MRKLVDMGYKGWVKGVNKQRVYDSINSVFSSTTNLFFMLGSKIQVVKPALIQVTLRFLNTNLSTPEKAILHQLYFSFPYCPQRLLLNPLKKF